MSKVKKTFLQLKTFEGVATSFLLDKGYMTKKNIAEKEAKDPQWKFEYDELKLLTSKLAKAIKKVFKELGPIFADMEETLDHLRDKHCAVAENKTMIRDTKGNRQYTPEGSIALKKETKEVLNGEIEINQFIVDEFEKLSESELEMFSEIVIPKQNTDDDESAE